MSVNIIFDDKQYLRIDKKNSKAKPPRMEVETQHIPEQLKNLPRWVCWKWEWRKDKWTKPLLNAKSGRYARSTDSTTWATYSEVMAAYQRNKDFAGIGFVFAADDNIMGVDVDACLNPDGSLSEVGQDAMRHFGDSYCEVSPSGFGLKFLICADLPGDQTGRKNTKLDVEAYQSGRYFTVTGRRWPGSPSEIVNKQDELIDWWAEVFPPAKVDDKNDKTPTTPVSVSVGVRDIVDRASAARNGDKFRKLWAGDCSEYSDDESSADLALCSILAFWCHGDANLIDEVFRASGLCRDKWTEREDYRSATIQKAIDGCREYYQWGRQTRSSPVPANDVAEQSVDRSYNQTDRNDIGNSKYFADTYRDELRYCVPWKKWHCWDGCRWKIDDEDRSLKLAKELTTKMFLDVLDHRGDNDGVGVALKHVCATAKLDRLKAMITLAGPDIPIRVSEMDTNHWILNCTNGLADLKTGRLLPHDRRLAITKLCPSEFQPDAESPLWKQFLRDVFIDDELIQFIQRLFGYCLTGDVSEQKLPIFFGTGANGKSTLLNAFMDTVGMDYTMQCMPDFLMKKKWEGHPTENARLFGQRFVSCVETDASCDLAESKVKMLTGGERINARRMKEDFWQFDPTHKIVLCTNHRPVIKGTDEGIWRRVLLVPFRQHFDESRQDKHLLEKLKNERVGILAWAVRGCLEWQRIGLNPPKLVCEATAEYRKSEDLIGRFLEHRCIFNRAHSIKFSDLYNALESFGRDSGDVVPDKRTVGIRLAERGFEKFTSNGTHYRGLLLRNSESPVVDVE